MKDLEALGFVQVRSTPQAAFAAALAGKGLSLPEDYLRSLDYVPPNRTNLGFRFRNSATDEEWEGQVAEFVDYSNRPDSLINAVIRAGEARLLPIAVDAGGNSVYLNLQPGCHAVMDQDYRTGVLSLIASSFTEFVRHLYAAE